MNFMRPHKISGLIFNKNKFKREKIPKTDVVNFKN